VPAVRQWFRGCPLNGGSTNSLRRPKTRNPCSKGSSPRGCRQQQQLASHSHLSGDSEHGSGTDSGWR